jgi:hypothetical protein
LLANSKKDNKVIIKNYLIDLFSINMIRKSKYFLDFIQQVNIDNNMTDLISNNNTSMMTDADNISQFSNLKSSMLKKNLSYMNINQANYINDTELDNLILNKKSKLEYNKSFRKKLDKSIL